MRSLATPLLASALVLGCTHSLNIPRPVSGGPGAPLPPLGASQIAAPLRADLGPTLRALDGDVPTRFGTDGRFQMIGPTPVGVRWSVERQPFRFSARDGVIHAEAEVSLRAEACLGAPMGIPIPFLSNGCQVVAQCGADSPIRLTVSADTAVTLDPSWRVVARTQPGAPAFHNRCRLTPLQVDVTDFVAGVVSQEVARATASLDRRVNAQGDLRPRGEAMWNSLQSPIDLGEGFTLRLNPESVWATPLQIDASAVTATVGVGARPVVQTGPVVPEAPRPLPPLGAAPAQGADGALRIAFDTTVGFDEVTRLASQQFVGQTLELEGYHARVNTMRVEPSGGGLLFSVGVTFADGPARGEPGTIYLTGVPDYDATRRALVVRQLDYSLETRSTLMQVGEWFLRSSLREGLAQRAVFPMGDRIDRMRASAQAALRRPLAQGTTLDGEITDVRPVGAFVTDAGVVVRVEATGRARIQQDLSGLFTAGG